jgi:hypothetical protein
MIEHEQRRMPEWLPDLGERLTAEIAELIATYFADQIGELCAGIQLTLQQHHDDVRIYPYKDSDLRQDWGPDGEVFKLAHISVVNWSHPKVVRFVQLRCEKATGHIVIVDNDELLEW